ncbi:TPA: hypothetical protein HA273_03090 [Candidatus Bathyarchaeota archaeon]|nr:hypothetical protein [Candidatus Bathyarchaeota archaeon]HIJ07740.1 hypothetical protein [Candidatus Bathyarchaeota archaeon]
MVEKDKKKPNRIKDISSRITIATVKATLIYLVYFAVSPFIMPLIAVVPGLAGSIEIFVAIYITLMILGDLTAGTIYNCFLNVGRALFVIAYLVLSIGDGIFTTSFEGFALTVDLTLVYTIAAMLSLLGLSKAVLQAINFMSERAESGTKP